MATLSLTAEKRTLLGKKAKKLRRQGFIAANLFGNERVSQAVTLKQSEFVGVYKKARTTHLVEVTLDAKTYPVLIQNVQKNTLDGAILHVDLREVNLKEKTETQVPVVLIGELDVVKSGEADALLLANKITIECLPAKIPDHIEIDISKLSGIGAEVLVKDLPVIADVTYMDEPEKVVLQISEAKKEEIVAPTADDKVVEAEVTTGAKEEGAEGEEAAATEEKKTDEKKD